MGLKVHYKHKKFEEINKYKIKTIGTEIMPGACRSTPSIITAHSSINNNRLFAPNSD